MADAHALGACGVIHGGSSPLLGTKNIPCGKIPPMTKKPFDRQPDGTLTFTLTLPKDDVAKRYQVVLQKTQQSTELKGFRRGHAPLNLVEASSDPAKLYSQVLEQLLPLAYSQFVSTNSLYPLIDPQITPEELKPNSDWVVQVRVAVAPEFKLGAYAKAVKAAITKHAKEHKEEKGKEGHADHLDSVIFDALLTSSELSISTLLIDEEAKSALSRLATQLAQLKLSVADYAKSIKKTTEELVADYKKTAETNLKLEFILQKLVEEQKPVISPEEIAKLKPAKGQEAYAKYVLQKRAVLDYLAKL